MLNQEQRKKLHNALNSVHSTELLLIPHRVQSRCILRAKSDKAKQRLVIAAVAAETTNMKQIHTGIMDRVSKYSFDYDMPHIPGKKSLLARVKDLLWQ